MIRALILLAVFATALTRHCLAQGGGETAAVRPSVNETNLTQLAQFRLQPTNISALASAAVHQIANTALVVTGSILPPASKTEMPKREYETIQILPPITMCDGFAHTIFIDHRTKQFWVLRTGGFAGVQQLFGPGNIQIEESEGDPGMGR